MNMKRVVRCGKNGRDRITVKLKKPENTVILTATNIYLPEGQDNVGLERAINSFLSSYNGKYNTVDLLTEYLQRAGMEVLNPCETQVFTR